MCLILISSAQVLASTQNLVIEPFDKQSFQKLRLLLDTRANVEFADHDFLTYKKRLKDYKQKKSVKFNQKDIILHTFSHLDRKLWDIFFSDQVTEFPDIQIELNRGAPDILLKLSRNESVPALVRAAADIAIFGTTHTPAIISNIFVDHIAGISSAYSTLNAEMAFVYEGFRPDTYHDLIIGHEGFHSAMRLLSTHNRMNRLAKLIPTPLASGADYDAFLEQDISDLENLAAPGLAELEIDQRFTSDHHGTIMASLHHGGLRAIQKFYPGYGQMELYQTKYPFHYIEHEKNWDEAKTLSMVEALQEKHDQFLMESDSFARMMVAIQEKLHFYHNIQLK